METTPGFDLTAAVARWREAFSAVPSVRAPDLDELESHLRDAVADLEGRGLSAEEAADWMLTAARTRPVRIAPRMAVSAKALDSIAPSLLDAIMKRGV